jgi:hypothetical protein
MKLTLSIIALLSLYTTTFCQVETYPVYIDGINAFNTSPDSYNFNSNLSLTGSSLADSFLISRHKKPDHSRLTLDINASLGAETGDPLLNTYSKPAYYENRDHRSIFTAELAAPRIPLTLDYRYRYIDTYSDRFDNLWTQYQSQTGRAMANSSEGLRYEHFADAYYQTENFIAGISYNLYKRWSATPYFFSPFFTDGTRINPYFQYSTAKTRLFSNVSFENKGMYYDHTSKVDYNDFSSESGIETKLGRSLTGKLEIHHDHAIEPDAALLVSIEKKAAFDWGITGTLFSNNHTALSVYSKFNVTQKVQCSLQVARDYTPRERDYFFLENNTYVKYKPIDIYLVNFYSTAVYTDTLLFPITLSAWFQYCSDPVWESVSPYSDTTYIQQMLPENVTRSIVGINGTYSINYKSFLMRIAPNFMYHIGDQASRFIQNKALKIDLSYKNSWKYPFSVNATLIVKDETRLNYIKWGNEPDLETFTIPAQSSVYLRLKMPIIIPLIEKLAENTAFVMDVGPVRLSKVQRIQEHPRGNLIGPAIYAGLEVKL